MKLARPQTRPEELANSVVHGFGLLASVVGLPLLVIAARSTDDALHLLGSAVFGTTMVLLYLSSTIYHALSASQAKQVFRVLDHAAIYLLIAGTYTPFALGALRGPLGWTVLIVMWSLAGVGIITKVRMGFAHPHLSTALYLVMGWTGVLVFGPLRASLPDGGFWLLLAGGLFYSGGVVFYATDSQMRFGHALWHLCVVAGTACHFVAVLQFSPPPA